MNSLRYPAVPLMTFDPYFSIWSFDDNLYSSPTRHWTGKKNSMVGMIKVGSKVYRFMGLLFDDGDYYYCEPDVIPQKKVTVKPTITEYEFENEIVNLKVRFINPVIANNLELLSRPIGYIEYEAVTKTGEDVLVYFDISCECCVDTNMRKVKLSKTAFGVSAENTEQNILENCGDDLRIDWGYLHLLDKDAFFAKAFFARNRFVIERELDALNDTEEMSVCTDKPVLAVVKKGNSGVITIGYEDIKCIEYFSEHLQSYYMKENTFKDICVKAIDEFEIVKKQCVEFDEFLIAKAEKINGKYADLICLMYRQAISAHKLTYKDDTLLYISKENYSNGCASTLDITYPSMPLFLLLNPELLKGMVNPIFDFVKTGKWEFEFAPHDVGCYPKLNGQVYGYEKDDPEWHRYRQMPVEECGNVIIAIYAYCEKTGSTEYALEHKDILSKWGEYLLNNAKDPGDQLCTDDFAGHQAHNANLSVKGTIALYAIGKLLGKSEYMEKAKEYAKWWEETAFEKDHYRMTFDGENTWSIKYNMVWDKIFGFKLYSDEVFKTETDFYLTKIEKYGIPLDSRSDVAKSDWIIWAAAMSDTKEKRDAFVESVWNMANETKQRVPLSDYYHASDASQHLWAEYRTWCGFQARSVVGAFAILML